MDKTFNTSFLYDKTKDVECQKNLMVRFLYETGLTLTELENIKSINDLTMAVIGDNGKIREVFHSAETTFKIKDLKVGTQTVKQWIKEVLGDEYTPNSIRKSHAIYLLENKVNPEIVTQNLGYASVEETMNYLQR